jgi:hypothetical protein
MKVAPVRARSTEVSFAFTIKARIEILSDSETVALAQQA